LKLRSQESLLGKGRSKSKGLTGRERAGGQEERGERKEGFRLWGKYVEFNEVDGEKSQGETERKLRKKDGDSEGKVIVEKG